MSYYEKLQEMINAPCINDVSHKTNANAGSFRSIAGMIPALFQKEVENIGWQLLDDHLPSYLKGLIKYYHDAGAIYVHDRSHLHLPYCYSFSLTDLLYGVNDFGRLKSSPCKRLDSYISVVNNIVSVFSQQIAGAVGLGSFFIDCGKLAKKQGLTFGGENDHYIQNQFQSFIHGVNHLCRGNESAFTNVSILDRKSLEAIPIVLEDEIPYILEVQRQFLKVFLAGDPLEDGKPFTFPVTTVNMAEIDPDFIGDDLGNNPDRVNFNISDTGKFSMCCRLQMDVNEMAQALGSSANSFAASPVEVGSHRVISINFNRLALEASLCLHPVEAYFSSLASMLKNVVIPALCAHRRLMDRMIRQGMLPLFDLGWMRLERMFSTVGIMGLVEASETLGDESLIARTLAFLNNCLHTASKKTGYLFNLEQIPGEEARFALAEKDKHSYPWANIPNLYSNQFVSLHKESDFISKMQTEGRYYKNLTGGGISHFRLPNKPTKEQTMEILRLADHYGCGHFAFSSTYSICEQGHCHWGKLDRCPTCGGKIIDYLERVIGYFAPVTAWGARSQQYDFPGRKCLADCIDVVYNLDIAR